MSKYYIPELKELYVGFEMEFRDDFIYEPEPTEWFITKCTPEWISQLSKQKSLNGKYGEWEVRVKYLDSQDIEKLGFKETYDDDEGNVWFVKNDYYIGLSEHTKHNIWIYHDNPGIREEDLFKGYIKNKSELERLLVQLKIREDE